MSEWVSVKDRLPENKEPVLAITNFGSLFVAWMNDVDDWQYSHCCCCSIKDKVTHFMPLPDAPNE